MRILYNTLRFLACLSTDGSLAMSSLKKEKEKILLQLGPWFCENIEISPIFFGKK